MTTGGDSGKPPVRLDLDILSHFDDADAQLDGDAIAQLTGLSSSTAQRSLVDLSRFGYVVAVEDGGYMLSGNCVGQVRCSGGSSASASA
jgi:DNA-binding IclR family transcriptional regulator